MQNIGRVNILQATQYLVEKVANMFVAQTLCLEQFVQIGFHQALNDIHVLHLVDAIHPWNIFYVYNLLREISI